MTISDLVAALRPCFQRGKLSLPPYPEVLNNDPKNRMIPAKNVACKAFMLALHKLPESATRGKNTLDDGIREVVRLDNDGWGKYKLEAGDIDDFVETCAKRLRVMMGHFSQSLWKKTRAKWTGNIVAAHSENRDSKDVKASDVDENTGRCSPSWLWLYLGLWVWIWVWVQA